MKIAETATLIFKFKGIDSQEKSYESLNEFLKENDWITAEGHKRLPLVDIHTSANGVCEVLLSEDKITDDYTDLIDDLYDSLVAHEDIMWIKILYSEAVSKLFYNHADRYSKFQTRDFMDIKPLDGIFVFVRK